METGQLLQIAIIVIAVLAILTLIWLFLRKRKTDHLRDQFGDEYDRTVDDVGKRSAAERNLEAREKRVAELEIRPLTIDERDRFAVEWKEVKALFVDSPQESVLRGDRLLGRMMETKGFPMGEFDRRFEDLSVNHGDVARHYRDGHDIAEKRGEATTEEMRRALNHYERLYDELVRDAGTGDAGTATNTRAVDTDGDGRADAVANTRSDGAPVRPQ